MTSVGILFRTVHVLPTVYQGGDHSFVKDELFKFPPKLILLTHLHKYGPHNKVFVNHVIDQKDIINGSNYGQELRMNVYGSFENLGNPLLFPQLMIENNQVDQSHIISFKFNIFFSSNFYSLPSNSSIQIHLFMRKDWENADLFETWLDVFITNGNDFKIEFYQYEPSTSKKYKDKNFDDITSITSQVRFSYFYLTVESTIFNTDVTHTYNSNHFTEQQENLSYPINVDDKLFIGNIDQTDKFATNIEQYLFMKIYEVVFFSGAYIDLTDSANPKTGLFSDQFSFNCPSTFGIRRFYLNDPFSIIYDTCEAESFEFNRSVSNCLVCEDNICYACGAGYKLITSSNSCHECKLESKTFDPILRKCIPYGDLDYSFPLTSTGQLTIDTASISVYQEGNSSKPDALHLETAIFTIKGDVTNPDFFMKVFDENMNPLQYI